MSLSGCGVAVVLGRGVELAAGELAVFSGTTGVRLAGGVEVATRAAEVLLGRLQPARSTTDSSIGRMQEKGLDNDL
jgi:hypothetical protein